MTHFWIDGFAWDLEAEGIDAAVARIRGDLGADDLRVQVHCDDVFQLRGRDLGGPRFLRMPAGAHYRPDPAHFAHTRLRPVAAAWMKSRDPFARIVDACRSAGLGLSVRASALRNRALAGKYPMLACVNAFGDVSPNRLCPANAEVGAFVEALARDLAASYPTRRVELSDLGYAPSAQAVEAHVGVALPGDLRRLVAWCFCPACRAAAAGAGCDVEAAVAAARRTIEAAFSAAGAVESGALDAARKAEPALRLYHDSQRATERRLVAGLDAALGEKFAISIDDPGDVTMAAALRQGVLAARHGPADGRLLRDAVGAAGGPARVGVRFDAFLPQVDSAAALVAGVHAAVEAGHSRIGLFADGLWSDAWQAGVRQAIRYARRA